MPTPKQWRYRAVPTTICITIPSLTSRTTGGTGEAQGIVRIVGTVTAKNNVVLDVISTGGAEECFLGTFTAPSTHNVSSDGTAAINANPNQTLQAGPYNTYFQNVTDGSEDLHLLNDSNSLWGSFGADLDSDPDLPVTDDIDGGARDPSTPDIGADEFGAAAIVTVLYRSVGTTAAALESGTTNALTISGSTATFASGLADNIGVGDAIQYDSDGNSTIDAIAFIHGRTSSTEYTVKDAAGNAPTAVAGDNDWGLYRAYTSLAKMGPGLVQEGENTLEMEEVGDTEAQYSMVMLDRFEVSYPAQLVAEEGGLKGGFSKSGAALVSGLEGNSFVFDTTGAQPQRLSGLSFVAGGMSYQVESGHRYFALSSGSVKTPEVRRAQSAGLKKAWSRAEYLVIGPRELLTAAEPLLFHRRDEGLIAGAIATEDIFDEFGYGEATPESVRDFLSYVYHHWSEPTLKYVVLLGDGTYDTKGCVPRFVEKERRPPLRHQSIISGGNLRVFENLAQTLVAVDAS